MRITCTLGVDIGTSSTKGVLVDSEGAVLASAQRVHEPDRPNPGWVEMDARLWWDEFCGITAELVAAVPEAVVIAVGVSGMGPCVLLADQDDVPVRAAILYGVDSRAGEQIDRLTAELGGDAIRSLGGSTLTSQAVGPKIAWVAENEPAAYGRARRLFMPASWIVRHLTGEYVLDHHSASQVTPLYDLHSLDWHRDWSDRIADGLELPRLTWAGEVAGSVTEDAARLTGLDQGTPVVTGTIDAWAEAASAGADRPGDLLLMYGTTMFLIATADVAVQTPSMWTTLGLRPGVTCLAGGMATSGAITNWIRDLVGGGSVDFAELLDEAGASGPGARGLLLLPYFAGERTPLQDPDARGVLAGVTLTHTRGDLYRAALEATAYGVRHNIETMREAGARIDRIVAVGGGTRGGLWTRIVSDVTGLDQEIPEITIGASYGMARLAASCGADPDRTEVIVTRWNPARVVIRRDPAHRDLYDEGYRRYRELYEATAPVVHELAASQRLAPIHP